MFLKNQSLKIVIYWPDICFSNNFNSLLFLLLEATNHQFMNLPAILLVFIDNYRNNWSAILITKLLIIKI